MDDMAWSETLLALARQRLPRPDHRGEFPGILFSLEQY